ncbi:hypothetical protein QJS04_geneDACA007971 [Acorus gramineus]|uniref:Uncharacterized protein n=1 Tax=Acorus gramineus TaxID=55184 RepID=A0AAV9BC93_ACOGR|nr:hypothetical protein QJS04_geneDACA007971 [Acorus gramineus]
MALLEMIGGGYGAFIRDDKSQFFCGLAGQNDLPTINLLELKAIEEIQHLWIESDSTTGIAWIMGKGMVAALGLPYAAFDIYIKGYQYILTDWKVSHIHREGNAPAPVDLLTAFQSARGETSFLPNDIRQELRSVLEQDQLGTQFIRKKG